MLLRSQKTIKYFLLLISFGIFISCGKDDPEPQTTSDDDPIIEEPFTGEIDFIKTYGGSNEDFGTSIIRSNDGGYMVLGSTKSSDGDLASRTGDDFDYWLLKLNASGDIVWNKTYGGSQDDTATNITQTSDGGYALSGYSRSSDGDATENAGFQDFWLVKISSDGTLQWQKSIGFSGLDQAFKMFETAEGNFFVTGFFDVSACGVNPCPGDELLPGNQTVVSKNSKHGVGEFWGILLDSNGEKIWRNYYGGTNNDRSYDAIQTSDGGFLLTGSSESVDFDITDAKGSYDFWAVRINASGEIIWTRSFGGSEIDVSYALTKTPDGNYIMVGDSRSQDQDVTAAFGNADAWAVKFDDNGSIIWQKSYGGSGFDSARSIAPLANGGYVLSGSSRSNDNDLTGNLGVNDFWLFTIDEEGELTFQTNKGGTDLDFSYSAVETSDLKLIGVGDTESNDIDIPSNRGSKDLLVIKIK
ncbi:hypothetical protein [Ulvibacter litoralis]|uniref:Bulb-type lectin domain-containing protein n=1 Tax=Ulvibacter litoralis TaxID=227084 RepID=A0A1G7CY14_9FLAO|nr:hypothetical protein [Ulvibacter litoralis]GHC45656.1 hypothetical protein GCM10008083_05640 [Ulvibacter litoralis]SDE44123.1 hypothetical protein SAMN05421855_101635 [Ulvibacter litoralis]